MARDSTLAARPKFVTLRAAIVAMAGFAIGASLLVPGSTFAMNTECGGLLEAAKPIWDLGPSHEIKLEPTSVPVGVEEINGEGYLRIERPPGRAWGSSYAPSGSDVQGDPRTLALILGARAAFQLGFSQLSKNVIYAPTATTLAKRLERLNQNLKRRGLEEIPLQFIETAVEMPGEEYLRGFTEFTSLPLAIRGTLAVHDLSYHAPSILVPPEDIRVVQRHFQYVRETLLRVHQVESPGLGRRDRENWAETMVEAHASYVDVGLGNLALLMPYLRKGFWRKSLDEEQVNFISDILGRLSGWGATPQVAAPFRLMMIHREFKLNANYRRLAHSVFGISGHALQTSRENTPETRSSRAYVEGFISRLERRIQEVRETLEIMAIRDAAQASRETSRR